MAFGAGKPGEINRNSNKRMAVKSLILLSLTLVFLDFTDRVDLIEDWGYKSRSQEESFEPQSSEKSRCIV